MTNSGHNYHSQLKELHSSEFEMASGEPDIRNWKVIGLQNQEVGSVEDLLFNEISHRVRYLIVRMDGKPLNLISRSILVPIGLVDLLREEKIVLLRDLTIAHLATLPSYEKGKLTRDTEFAVREVLTPGYIGMHRDKDISEEAFYDEGYFNNRRFADAQLKINERNSAKDEIRENIERMKESVKKMETELEKLDKSH